MNDKTMKSNIHPFLCDNLNEVYLFYINCIFDYSSAKYIKDPIYRI